MDASTRTVQPRTLIGGILAAALCIASAGCAGGAAQTRPSTPYKGDAVWNISSATSAPQAAAIGGEPLAVLSGQCASAAARCGKTTMHTTMKASRASEAA